MDSVFKRGVKSSFPNLTSLVELLTEKEDGKYVYDFSKLSNRLLSLKNDVETIEIYYS